MLRRSPGPCWLVSGPVPLPLRGGGKNPLKHGRFMAGSWVPILSEEQMRKEKPKYAVVLPWSFKKEFVQRERKIREAGTTLVFPLPSPEFVF